MLEADGGPGATALIESLRRAIIDGKLDIEVCYCSVFDQCWTAALRDIMKHSRGETVRRDTAIEGGCADVASSGI